MIQKSLNYLKVKAAIKKETEKSYLRYLWKRSAEDDRYLTEYWLG